MSIWFTKVDIDTLNSISQNTMSDHMGMEYVEIGDDFIKAKLPVDHRNKQPYGILHGGASVAMGETLGSVASSLCVDIGKNKIVGTEISGTHLRPGTTKYVYGIVSPIKIGKKIHVWEIKIIDENEKLINITRLSVMIIPV